MTWVMWNLTSFTLEIVLGSEQDRCTPNVPSAQKSFWTHPLGLLGDEAQVEAHFSLSDIELILTLDRCIVCVERTIGSKIVLDASDGNPR